MSHNSFNIEPQIPSVGAGPQNLTTEEVDRLLLSSKKIKNRSRKACYPCNRRKIRCDRDVHQPCTNCVKHSHPELCSWTAEGEENRPKRTIGTKRSHDESVGQRREQRRESITPIQPPYNTQPAVYSTPQASISSDSQTHPHGHPRSTREPTLENVVHNYRSPSEFRTLASAAPSSPRTPSNMAEVPNRSVASLVQDQAGHTHLIGVPSMLGLENQTASYLFIKASDAQERWRQLHSMLPTEKEVFKFFGYFKTLALPFNATLLHPDEFESFICKYVEDLAHPTPARFENDRAVGCTALVLAVLSCGVQLSNLPLQERTRLARDYARKSFHCLRLTNFLMRPSEENVQALLLLSQVLQNDLQAFSAWSLLGTTIRLAQSLGLDIRQRRGEEREILGKRYRKLWRAVLWQDAVLSLCLGRPPSAHYRTTISMPPWDNDNLSYFDCMFCLCDCVMRVIDPVRPEARSVTHALSDVQRMESIFAQAAPHLQNKEHCKSMKDRMEHYALQLHVNFTISYVCQMALREIEDDPPLVAALKEKCKGSLVGSVRGYVSLSALTIVPLRGWTYVHHALSSALLLGLMGETKSSPEVKSLQESLISVLSTTESEPDSENAAGNSRFTNRHARALEALQAMCVQASATGSPSHHGEDPGGHDVASSQHAANGFSQQHMHPSMQQHQQGQGHWNNSQADLIRSPNGTVVTPETFWDSLFADSTISADLGWTGTFPYQEPWGL